MEFTIFWVSLDFQVQNGGPKWLPTPYWKPLKVISLEPNVQKNKQTYKQTNGATFPTKFGNPYLMEIIYWVLKPSWLINPRWPSRNGLRPWASDAIFKYINSHFSRVRCVTNSYKVSFSTNSGFADLIEWYSLYCGFVLIFKFKMAVQNGGPKWPPTPYLNP